MTMKEAVRDTAELLDRDMPGWEEYIDADRLNIASAKDCVFGQVYGGFGKGLKALGIPAGVQAGVSLPMGTRTPRQDWATLKDLWIEQRDLRLMGEEAMAEEMAAV
jgi:hypothetical protein